MKKWLVFVLATLTPGLALAQHGGSEGIIIANLWGVVLAPVVIAFIMLGFFEWKVIFFYIAIVVVTYVAYGFFVFFFWWERDLSLLFFIASNVGLLGFPLVATYGFYRKTKK
ncbi:MAG: hypothetical protein FWF41_04510 [Betaproteobacteria bacterium]|nr:hypothetical protein [Betaproteobacteria bacterium]